MRVRLCRLFSNSKAWQAPGDAGALRRGCCAFQLAGVPAGVCRRRGCKPLACFPLAYCGCGLPEGQSGAGLPLCFPPCFARRWAPRARSEAKRPGRTREGRAEPHFVCRAGAAVEAASTKRSLRAHRLVPGGYQLLAAHLPRITANVPAVVAGTPAG
jgi:hypothetical protein